MSARLSDALIRNLGPGAEISEVDLRVRKNGDGTATFYVRPRVNGNRPKIVVGKWPEKRLVELRDAAREALKVARATPPKLAPPRPRGPTVGQALEQYRDRRLRQTVRWENRWRELDKHVLPKLGSRPLADIRRSDVGELLDGLPVRPATTKLQTYLATSLNWCVDAGLLEASPMARMRKRCPYRPRTRVLDVNELSVLGRNLDPPGKCPFSDIVRLLTLTAQRRGEIAGLTWGQISSNRLRWEITKNGTAHEVPLVASGLQLIDRYKAKRGGDPPVFEHFCGWSRRKERLDKRSGVRDWTLHDLRRTIATHLGDLGGPGAVVLIERILNHRLGSRSGLSGVASIYQRNQFHKEAEELLASWERMLKQLGWRF